MGLISSINKRLNSENGFSLIELAIWLVIIGIFTAAAIQIHQLYLRHNVTMHNKGKLNVIENAILDFIQANASYPYPADLTATETDADAGKEITGFIPDCTAWPAPEGVCSTATIAYPNRNDLSITVADKVVFGAVPYEALGLTPEDSYDYWGNKILYAVTESRAIDYPTGYSGITIRGFDATNTLGDITNPARKEGLADMVIISHGNNAAGAYSAQGAPSFNACLFGGAVEGENCDFDDVFIAREREVANGGGSASDKNDATYFDDYVDFIIDVSQEWWAPNMVNSNYTSNMSEVIGIGTSLPTERLEVVGDIGVSDDLISPQVCDETTFNCITPELLQNDPALDCDTYGVSANRAVMDVGDLKFRCNTAIDLTNSPIDVNGVIFTFPSTIINHIECTGGLFINGYVNGMPNCI